MKFLCVCMCVCVCPLFEILPKQSLYLLIMPKILLNLRHINKTRPFSIAKINFKKASNFNSLA